MNAWHAVQELFYKFYLDLFRSTTRLHCKIVVSSHGHREKIAGFSDRDVRMMLGKQRPVMVRYAFINDSLVPQNGFLLKLVSVG